MNDRAADEPKLRSMIQKVREGGASGRQDGRRKVFLRSFGCQMNVYDASRMADMLASTGFDETSDISSADLIILNTCHIREHASEKVFSELGKIAKLKEDRARRGADTIIAVAGCVAQAEGAEIVKRQKSRRPRDRTAELSSIAGTRRQSASPSPAIVDTEFPVEDKFDYLAASFGSENRRARLLRLRHGSGGMRQILHLLRRSLYARCGSLAAGRQGRRGSRASGPRRRSRSDAARPERQCLSWQRRKRRPPLLRRAPASRRGRSQGSPACAIRRAIRATCMPI